tara:strand:+ start:756 stop:923 length:168 start_codon:yes stop_codon:yes gene_type:complete
MPFQSSTESEVRKLSVLLPKSTHLRLKKKAVCGDSTITDVVTALIDQYLYEAVDS